MTKKLEGPLNGNPEEGKKVAMNTGAGNCWACHALPGDGQPGNQGPSLIDYGKRGMTDAEVYQIIYDRRSINPMTAMPPFGTLGTLSDQQVRDITAFLQSLK
jgi:sulfur oxidation c-type cytochrome SoxX